MYFNFKFERESMSFSVSYCIGLLLSFYVNCNIMETVFVRFENKPFYLYVRLYIRIIAVLLLLSNFKESRLIVLKVRGNGVC